MSGKKGGTGLRTQELSPLSWNWKCKLLSVLWLFFSSPALFVYELIYYAHFCAVSLRFNNCTKLCFKFSLLNCHALISETSFPSQVVSQVGWYHVQQECPTCNGEGQIITQKCKSCHGKGTSTVSEEAQINIPSGRTHTIQLSFKLLLSLILLSDKDHQVENSIKSKKRNLSYFRAVIPIDL